MLTFSIISLDILQGEINAAYFTGLEVEAASLEAALPKARKALAEARGERYLREVLFCGSPDESRIYLGSGPRYMIEESFESYQKRNRKAAL